MKGKIILFGFVIFLIFAYPVYSQTPPPPPNSGNEGGPVGGSAPIGDGVLIMIFLAAAYASRKIYLIRQSDFNAEKK